MRYAVLQSNQGMTAVEAVLRQVTGTHTEVDAAGVVEALTSARNVIIVPGYGLAVAGAQYAIADLVKTLRSKGVDVKYAPILLDGPCTVLVVLLSTELVPPACGAWLSV